MVSLRLNYFIFVGYLKTGDREGVRAIPLNPLWIRLQNTKADKSVYDNCLELLEKGLNWHLCHDLIEGERTKAHWDKSPLGQKPTGQYPTGQKPTA